MAWIWAGLLGGTLRVGCDPDQFLPYVTHRNVRGPEADTCHANKMSFVTWEVPDWWWVAIISHSEMHVLYFLGLFRTSKISNGQLGFLIFTNLYV